MIEALGLSFILVPALTTFLWFLSNIYLALPLNLITLTIVFVISITINYFLAFRLYPLRENFSLNKLDIFLLILLIGVLGLNLVRNYYWPVSIEFDSVANYDYRAKVFTYYHQITGLTHPYHVSYPLFTSLGHTAMYNLGFANPKPFYSMLLWGFLLVFFAFLKSQSVTTTKSLLGCLLLITTPSVFYYAGIAYTNFPYLVYLSGSWLYLILYLQKSNPKHLIIFSLLMAFSAWVRPANHPFFLTSIFLLLLYRRNILVPILTYLAVYFPWYYFQNYILTTVSYETARTLQGLLILPKSLFLLPLSIQAIFANLTNLDYSGAVGLLFIFTTVLKFKKNITWLVLIANLSCWLVLSLTIRAEYYSFSSWYSILYDSMRRLFIVFFPIIIAICLLPHHQD